MINSSNLTGRLTRTPELRYTGSGKAVVQFTLAVDRAFTNSAGEREADFVQIVAWNKTAELIANNLIKGSLCGVTGRIQTRNYTNNEGSKVYITEVVCENLSFLESKRESNGNQSNDNESDKQDSNTQTNQNQNRSQFDKDPFEQNDDPIDISDDDLPF